MSLFGMSADSNQVDYRITAECWRPQLDL